MSPERKARGQSSARRGPDILTDAWRTANPTVPPRGLPFAAMSGEERHKLIDLVKLYIGRASDEVAANRWRKIEATAWTAITFAWLGSEEVLQGHYYTRSKARPS